MSNFTVNMRELINASKLSKKEWGANASLIELWAQTTSSTSKGYQKEKQRRKAKHLGK